MTNEQRAVRLTKELADQGKLIEAGWLGFRMMVMAPDAPDIQLVECRLAFMAGAQHLFGSIMTMLDPGTEESQADLRKMDLIDRELRNFARELDLKLAKTGGSA